MAIVSLQNLSDADTIVVILLNKVRVRQQPAIYWHMHMNRWKFTTCTQQRHGTNCVWAYIGTNHPFAIIWCRNRAWDALWDGIVLLILLQMTQCGVFDKWHVAQIILHKNTFSVKQYFVTFFGIIDSS